MEKKDLIRIGKWSLTIADDAIVTERHFDPKTPSEVVHSDFLTVPATVPGNFELDLFRAGIEPDPYFGQNPFLYQKYETFHLWYGSSFSWEGTDQTNLFLLFEGIDTVADIFLNGVLLGHTDNMLIPHEFPVSGLLREQNELLVHIFPTICEGRKHRAVAGESALFYNRESLSLRKSPSMFGWDIMPRFVSGGLWKPVYLTEKKPKRIEQFYLYTGSLREDLTQATMVAFYEVATDSVNYRLDQYELNIHATCGDSVIQKNIPLWSLSGNVTIPVDAPQLWYPQNAGGHPLYKVEVLLLCNGVVCDRYQCRVGIRTVELERTSVTDADGNGEFVFRVNHKKVFCLGTNWVPLDAFPSRFPQYLQRALNLLLDSGCNMVRCWGGNCYENDPFYDFCDENGIMVWQDFSMACAVYPQDNSFAAQLYQEAESVIKRLRAHCSLVIWAGNNEGDLAYSWEGTPRNPNFDRPTRETIPQALRDHDPSPRPYLPSSPYIDRFAWEKRKEMKTSEDHLWGPRDDFKGAFYSNSVCHFASEIGYHGCPSPDSLAKFIPKNVLWPICNAEGVPDDSWICHASSPQPGMGGPYSYRIGLMLRQVEYLFGSIAENVSDFVKQSQISQAEAMKYFIERFRISKWRRTGIIWWNLIDGWPQVSDAVVDWYGNRKLAYSFIRRSQKPMILAVDEPKDGRSTIYAVNETSETTKVSFAVRDVTTGYEILKGNATAFADSSTPVAVLPHLEGYHFLLITWEENGKQNGTNHFVTDLHHLPFDQYLRDLHQVGYDKFEGFESLDSSTF